MNVFPNGIKHINLRIQYSLACPCCHLPYEALPGSVDSEIIEVVSVSAYCRKIHKKIYKRKCTCKKNPDPIIMSPLSERLLPKSKFGMTIWALLLLKKYENDW